jgi:predicted alpha/beta superfamily hydrolase
MKRTLKSVWSPERRNRRDVDVYLPASYRAAGPRRYPVVYMQDGQNLSDPATAFAGTWDLEPTLERLAARGLEMIVVGVHHAGEERPVEYSPFPDRRLGGGEGESYLAFLVDTLKPRIDRMFRTRTHCDETAILGSSMGALISLYAFFRHPSVFGRAGVMSPSVWFGQGAILDYIAAAKAPGGRVYLDVGMREGAGTLRQARQLARLLVRKGFRRDRRALRRRDEPHAFLPRQARMALSWPKRRSAASKLPPRGAAASQLRYVEDPGGGHQEAAWAHRLEGALDFLID